MNCIYCQSNTYVTNSRPSKKQPSVWRRRQCKDCRAIFTTREQPDLKESMRVQSRDKTLQPFIQEKLLLSVHGSLLHRKNALNDAIALKDTITNNLIKNSKDGIIKTQEIIKETERTLRHFDKAAVTHYSAHHN